MDRTTVEIWLTMDSEGQWDVAADRDTALERHVDNSGVGGALAVHKLILSVPLPQDIPTSIVLPDDATGEAVVLEE